MTQLEAQKYVKLACSKIKEEDITHRGFLKPIEIALKTYKTQINENECKLKPDSLPNGLKIAVRASVNSDKRILQNLEYIQPEQSYQQLKENNKDNLLALMKHVEGLQLAICVCMYSEDKKMLKSTLAGVSENIANFVAYERMDPDRIGVFVMMDGIEKVDPSVIDYFQQLERSSNINLGDNISPSLSFQQMAKRASVMTEQQINEQEMKNVNNFLFDVAQVQQRNRLRFASVRKEYDQTKNILKTIKVLQQGRSYYQDLPTTLQPFFIEQAKEQRKKDYVQTDQDVNAMSEEKLIQQYATDTRRSRPLVMKALQQAQRHCNDYLSSREDLAYLGYFRKKVPFSITHKTQSQKAEGPQSTKYIQQQNDELNEEFQDGWPCTTMNIFLCVKYKNSGKLSSHNWFFNGFCKELRPKYAVLLDVGLKPEGEALVKMHNYMKMYSTGQKKVGGVCGYMSLKIEKLDQEEGIKDQDIDFLTSILNKFTDIQRTQQVQYHFAHLMDKPFEASFGFIHVLPGAFSAYNMQAITNYKEDEDDVLLKSYFKSIDQKIANQKIIKTQMGVQNVILRTALPDLINRCFISVDPESDQAMLYNENVYLAQDRILCMGIHKKNFDMAYLPDAYAQVDPIKTVHGLLGQRKRWINGSYFAFEKVKKQLSQHQKSNGYELGLNVQIFYLTLMNSLSYFSPSLFLFTVDIAMEAFRQDVLINVLGGVVSDPNTSQFYNAFVYTMDFFYVLLLMSIIFFSLHLANNHKRFKPYIYGISTLFGLFMICVFLVLIVDVFRGLIDNSNFLAQNAALIQSIPGGINTVNAMRWMLVASVLVYIIPISVYIILFGNMHILCQIILGSFSFLFYGPTYLNILNIYSLCRIDDISWGTKGLDSGSTKNANLKDSWKLIKFVHVAKYVIWNIIVGVILLTLGSSYATRFFVTIGMVILIGISMAAKVIIGTIYMITYKCKTCGSQKKDPILNTKSRISSVIGQYKQEIMNEVVINLNKMKDQFLKNNVQTFGSFIQVGRTKAFSIKALEKQQAEQKGKSSIVKKPATKFKRENRPLPTISEQEDKSKPIKKKPKQVQKPKQFQKPKQTPKPKQIPKPKVQQKSSRKLIQQRQNDEFSNEDLNSKKSDPFLIPPKEKQEEEYKIVAGTTKSKQDKDKFRNVKK